MVLLDQASVEGLLAAVNGTMLGVAIAGTLATLGLLLTAIFILTVIQRVFTGPLNPQHASFPDLTRNERLALAPAIILMFVLGLYPQLILGAFNATVVSYVQHLAF